MNIQKIFSRLCLVSLLGVSGIAFSMQMEKNNQEQKVQQNQQEQQQYSSFRLGFYATITAALVAGGVIEKYTGLLSSSLNYISAHQKASLIAGGSVASLLVTYLALAKYNNWRPFRVDAPVVNPDTPNPPAPNPAPKPAGFFSWIPPYLNPQPPTPKVYEPKVTQPPAPDEQK